MTHPLACCLLALSSAALAESATTPWKVVQPPGEALRVEADGETLLAWQQVPLAKPTGGAKFAGSAFFHPLRTPSGFACTDLQPADHLHHFGLWWPWKFIEVDGKIHNTWEVQEGQGAHVARSTKVLESTPNRCVWELGNEVLAKTAGGGSRAVIAETTRAVLTRAADRHVLDLEIHQKPLATGGVTIVQYRYSGFSWRGPATWNAANSRMLTSAGKDRDSANGTRARWVLVTGERPGGKASVLLLSAASTIAGIEEQVRVWDSKAAKGAQFANFNPVMEKPLPLDPAHPAVAKRHYRVVLADRALDAAEAEAAWRAWTAE